MENRKQLPSESAASALVSELLHRFYESNVYLRGHMDQLLRLASSSDEETARGATLSIFASLVEPLADSFEPRAVTLYNRLFSQLIQFFRSIEQGRLLDCELTGFGLASEEDLIARAERLRQVFKYEPAQGLEIKRAVVLSRVTLGADVAITSVAVERLKRRFPDAEIVLTGGRKMQELFGGDKRLAFRETAYERAGTMIGRLLSWIDLLCCVRELIDGLAPGQYLILDPDTRLTQSGILPLVANASASAPEGRATPEYLFFPSREYGSDTTYSLAELTSLWLDEVFVEREAAFPRISLKEDDRRAASALIEKLRQGGERPVVTINFGVGENPMKRVSDDFEVSLVNLLIRDGATVILDRGAGEDETKRMDEIISSIARADHRSIINNIVEVDEETLPDFLRLGRIDARLAVWRGPIGLLAALIARSDLYIGYDSAGQHIAAALGVPVIDIFAGFSSPRMIERWRPTGPAEVRVIPVDATGKGAALELTLDHARAILKR